MTTLKLYGHPVSPYVRKVRLILRLHDLEHVHEPVPPHSDDEAFRAASPLGRIPALQDEHVAFSDSSVIAHYLCKFYGDNCMLPQDRAGFTQTLWWEEYADSVMVPVIAGHLFAEVVLAGRLFPRGPIQEDIDKAVKEELPRIYALLNESLEGREWLVGDKLSLADIAVGGLLIPLYHAGQRVPQSAPNLQAYVQRFFELPEVSAMIREEVEMLDQLGYQSPLAGA